MRGVIAGSSFPLIEIAERADAFFITFFCLIIAKSFQVPESFAWRVSSLILKQSAIVSKQTFLFLARQWLSYSERLLYRAWADFWEGALWSDRCTSGPRDFSQFWTRWPFRRYALEYTLARFREYCFFAKSAWCARDQLTEELVSNWRTSLCTLDWSACLLFVCSAVFLAFLQALDSRLVPYSLDRKHRVFWTACQTYSNAIFFFFYRKSLLTFEGQLDRTVDPDLLPEIARMRGLRKNALQQ